MSSKLTFSTMHYMGPYIRVSNSLDADLLSGPIWVQTVCKNQQQTTKLAASGQRVLFQKYNTCSLTFKILLDSLLRLIVKTRVYQ